MELKIPDWLTVVEEDTGVREANRPKAEPPYAPPDRYAGCRFKNFENPPERVKQWVRGEGDGRFVYIYGTIGSGKTHLATAMWRFLYAKLYRQQGHARPSPQWWDASNYLEVVKDEFDSDRGNTHIRAARASVLLLDDLGAERLTDWSLNELSWLIRERWNSMLWTIITSNLHPSRLEQWEPRIASRLLGVDTLQVLLQEPDRRKP